MADHRLNSLFLMAFVFPITAATIGCGNPSGTSQNNSTASPTFTASLSTSTVVAYPGVNSIADPITIIRNGSTASLSTTVTGNPPEVSVAVQGPATADSGSLTLGLKASAPVGDYLLNVNISDGTNSLSLPLKLTVAPTPYWKPPAVGSVNSLGTVTLPTSSQGTVTLLTPSIASPLGSLNCTETSWDLTGTQLTITYTVASTVVHVTIQVQQTDAGISAQLDADQPVISMVDMGAWNSALSVKSIAVPYYSNSIWYSQGLSEFINSWWDWHSTNATAMSGTEAQYKSKTDGTLNTMHELLEIAASPNVDNVFPYPGNTPSPYLATMAGRLVLDIWDSGFAGIQQNLAALNDYGIGNCIGIIHNWQHAGYDNALPEHYSANDSLGGSSAIQAAIAQGTENGCLMAVHENYVDYYPNYPLFNSAAVALNSDGSQMLSWLNTSTDIQSFSTKPTWMMTDAETQSPEIHQAYKTTADYLDVHSGVLPSSHGDMDASTPGAGMLTTWVQSNQALWAYERQTHGGPVLGEGRNHWYYSGLLDGVEAQMGAGSVASNLDNALALFVDFDLLRIHPLQINHGMGYYERWTKAGTPSMTTAQMDAYRMQEIAFGHAPFLSKGTWSDIYHALLESNLVSPVAAGYGTAQASSIQYGVDGSWISSSIATQNSEFAQVQVAYNNGMTVVANSASDSLNWNGLTIPQYGWAAKSNDLLAYTAMCGSTVCDYAQTATTIFANARNQADVMVSSGVASPTVKNVTQGNSAKFSITYNWQVYNSPGNQIAYTAFVHFVNDTLVTKTDSGIVFQGDHHFSKSTTQWSVGDSIDDGPITVSIPPSVPDGIYSIRVGLYDPSTGQRLQLVGNNDGTQRYIIGSLTISNGGSSVSFAPPAPATNDPRLNPTGSIVDFGPVKTDGMLSIAQEDGMWVLRPFPRYRNFTIYLNSDDYSMPSTVQAGGSTESTVIPIAGGSYWQLPLNGSKTYSWPVN
jgi:hypothetical protein